MDTFLNSKPSFFVYDIICCPIFVNKFMMRIFDTLAKIVYGYYPFSVTTKIGNLPLPFFVVITLLLSWVIFINYCICILTGSPG